MLSEIGYILCRIHGIKESQEILPAIEAAIIDVNLSKLYKIASEIKCQFPISLSDCFSIATGKYQACPIIFKKEAELSETRITEIEQMFEVSIFIT